MEKLSFSPQHLKFFDYVKAVGTGVKGNRDLSYDECKDAFEILLQQEIPNELIGGFLVGIRLKLESDEELRACVDAIDSFKTVSTCKGVEIGYALDGKTKFPPLMMQASKYIPEIALHVSGDKELAPKYGYTPKQFDTLFEFPDNLHVYDKAITIPELSKLTNLRNNINLRTIFNTVEKLSLIGDCAVIGMHHGPYFDKYTKLYANKYRRVMIIQGSEGSPEILKKAKYKLIEGETITEGVIEPEAFEISSIVAKEDLSESQMKSIFENADENLEKMIQLNGAVLAYVYGQYESIESAYKALN